MDTSYHSTLSKGSTEKKNSCADQIPFLSKIESQAMKPYFIHCIEAYSTPVSKGDSVMIKGLRSAQQISSSSQGVHLL